VPPDAGVEDERSRCLLSRGDAASCGDTRRDACSHYFSSLLRSGRAKANETPTPKVVFTNYANPLPTNSEKCPDTSWLHAQQTEYLSCLVDQINETVKDTIGGLGHQDVGFADLSNAYAPNGASHIWCTDDPWAYGLSIYKVSDPVSFESDAPFHSTPAGQRSIAERIIPSVRKLVSKS
jgi:hypothetical protein